MKLTTILPSASLFLLAAASSHHEHRAVHIARQARCGIKGWDTGLTAAYWYMVDASLTNQKACGEKCAVDTKCQSFAVNAQACLLYDKSVYVYLPSSTFSLRFDCTISDHTTLVE